MPMSSPAALEMAMVEKPVAADVAIAPAAAPPVSRPASASDRDGERGRRGHA
jgi:hypothetical protein